jgi:hypothetical protein
MTPIRQRHWTTAAILIATTVALGATAPERGAERTATQVCLRCGSTCDLEPVCVCTPSTKKKPKVEYEVDCEPICLAGCASRPWRVGHCHPVGCTSCDPEPCDCPSRIRSRKLLRKETTDEDVRVVERNVAYLCGPCAGRASPGCCDQALATPSSSWWARLTSWWP